MIKAASGGCTHFFTTPDPEGGVMTAAFGQGCVSLALHITLIRESKADRAVIWGTWTRS